MESVETILSASIMIKADPVGKAQIIGLKPKSNRPMVRAFLFYDHGQGGNKNDGSRTAQI
jgi:hypothetical protein